VLALVGVLSAIAIPQVLVGVDRSRTVAAAHYVQQQCGAARLLAVSRSANVGVRFREQAGEYVMQTFVDRNRNGVRTADIDDGVDVPLGPPESLGANFPGVRIGLAPGLGSDPVKLGRSGLVVFTPLGTATPGSIFVVGKDGTQFAIRVLGATARTRLERYDRRLKTWTSSW
jgi:type II secretory pathway pseudopilin PulG